MSTLPLEVAAAQRTHSADREGWRIRLLTSAVDHLILIPKQHRCSDTFRAQISVKPLFEHAHRRTHITFCSKYLDIV